MKLQLQPEDLASIQFTILRWSQRQCIDFKTLVEDIASKGLLSFLDITSTDHDCRMRKNAQSIRRRLLGEISIDEDFFPAFSASLPRSLRAEVWEAVSGVIERAGMTAALPQKVQGCLLGATEAHSKETADLQSLLPRMCANLGSNDVSYLIQIRREAIEALSATETLVHQLNDRIESRKRSMKTNTVRS